MLDYVFEGLKCGLSFLSVEFSIAILVKLLGHNIVLPAYIAIAIQVIRDMGLSLSMSLLCESCPCLLFLVGDAWAGPPIGNADILSQNV